MVLQNLGVPNSTDYDGTKQIMAFDVVVAEATDPRDNDMPSLLDPAPPRWTSPRRCRPRSASSR